MTETTVLDDGLLEALSMIDLIRWGRVRHAIVCQVRKGERTYPDGWARLSSRALARKVKSSHRYVFELVGSEGRLWKAERVLLREAGDRGRVSRLKVNPRIGAWRGVPWVEADPDIVELRLFRASERDKYDGHLSRSYGATSSPNLSRSHSATSDPNLSRSYGATSAPELVAMGGAWSGTSEVSAAPPIQLSGVSKETLSLGAERESEDFVKVEAALRAKTGGWLGGRLVPQVRRLVASHDVALLLDAVADAPAAMHVPEIVETWLPSVASGRIRPSAGPDLERELSIARRQADAYVANGCDVPQELLDVIDACENGLNDLEAKEEA